MCNYSLSAWPRQHGEEQLRGNGAILFFITSMVLKILNIVKNVLKTKLYDNIFCVKLI